jgi:hypothetical protein
LHDGLKNFELSEVHGARAEVKRLALAGV